MRKCDGEARLPSGEGDCLRGVGRKQGDRDWEQRPQYPLVGTCSETHRR